MRHGIGFLLAVCACVTPTLVDAQYVGRRIIIPELPPATKAPPKPKPAPRRTPPPETQVRKPAPPVTRAPVPVAPQSHEPRRIISTADAPWVDFHPDIRKLASVHPQVYQDLLNRLSGVHYQGPTDPAFLVPFIEGLAEVAETNFKLVPDPLILRASRESVKQVRHVLVNAPDQCAALFNDDDRKTLYSLLTTDMLLEELNTTIAIATTTDLMRRPPRQTFAMANQVEAAVEFAARATGMEPQDALDKLEGDTYDRRYCQLHERFLSKLLDESPTDAALLIRSTMEH